MGSLGLHADPDGWLNAGYSVRTLMDSLDSELYDADRIGGAGLSQSWAGPVAEAFTGHWSGVRSRAEDLIAQGRRAAAAMTDFGGSLEDFVKRAADLERYWLRFGLQLGLDGMHFALPWGFEQLSPVHQVSFHQWLTESERDVTAMWADIQAAVDDVVTALESLIAAFEDFAVLELGTAAGAVLLAFAALYWRRLPLLRRGFEPGTGLVRPLRRFQSGGVNDYVTWIVIGVACLGGALAFSIHG